jgi:lipoate---protein ligase
MNLAGIPLVRRMSGGGTVFHDPGNINFSFISSKDVHDVKRNFDIVLEALSFCKIQAVHSERNDINVNDCKVSGNAFKITKRFALHHGTLLLNSNLGRLKNFLTPDLSSIATKAVESVRSRVINLSQIDSQISAQSLEKQLVRSFFYNFGHDGTPETVQPDRIISIPDYSGKIETMQSWDWLFGKTPDFSVDAGNHEIRVKKGLISSVHLKGTDGKYNDELGFVGKRFDIERYNRIVQIPSINYF